MTLTDYNGRPVEVPADGILISEQPVGQTMITFVESGMTIQVQESVEQVIALQKREKNG